MIDIKLASLLTRPDTGVTYSDTRFGYETGLVRD
jgi:hypothetical protein